MLLVSIDQKNCVYLCLCTIKKWREHREYKWVKQCKIQNAGYPIRPQTIIGNEQDPSPLTDCHWIYKKCKIIHHPLPASSSKLQHVQWVGEDLDKKNLSTIWIVQCSYMDWGKHPSSICSELKTDLMKMDYYLDLCVCVE